MAEKPYFTNGVNLAASDRDLVTSTTMYSGQLKRYFSSLDAEVFIGGERILDIVRLDFSYEEKKMPFYGFNSFWPSRIFVGQKIIQGTFAINFTEPGYIAKLLQKIEGSAAQDSASLVGQTCSLENSPLFGKAFDILVGYGGFNVENEASFRNTHQILEGVMVNGYSQILDTSGEPVMEVYSFIAKNLKFGGYEFDKNSYNDDIASSDSDIGSSGPTNLGGIEIVEKRISGDVADLRDKCHKDSTLLGVIVDVTNALHFKDDKSHIYIDFAFLNDNNTYVKENVSLTIHDNELGISETYTLIKKKDNTFGYILDEAKTKLVKEKLSGKKGSQKLISCSISGAFMHDGKREPFNKKVCMRPGTRY